MVKCADCGYLAYWMGTDDFPAVEGPTRKGGPHSGDFVCFVQKLDFKHEVSNHNSFDSHFAQWSIIDTERDCEEFIQWRQGHSPKEHGAMFDRQWMIDREDRRDNEMRSHAERLAEIERRNQAHLQGQADAIQGQMADAARAAAHWQFWSVVVAMVGIIAAVVIGAWAISSNDQPVNNNYNNPTFILPTQSVPDTATPQPLPTE